jgi:hypothetical protein
VQPDPGAGQHQPGEGGAVLEHHRLGGRVLGLAQVLPEPTAGVAGLAPDLADGADEGDALGQERDGQHDVGR